MSVQCDMVDHEVSAAATSQLVVGIAELKISNNPADTIITYALGSCIGVMTYDPVRGVGGLLHYMLPLSSTAPAKAKLRPGMFADTGIPLLFQKMYAQGCCKQDIVVKVAGGGSMYDGQEMFNIGKRNYTAMRRLFWKSGVLITAEDVGGNKSRTTRLHVANGRVTVHSRGQEWSL